MKKAILLLMGFALAAGAQIVQHEITKPTTPMDDAKPNSDKVPEGVAVSGQFERVVIFRFKYQTDLLAGIENLIRKEGIKNAVILSGVGSVRNYQVHSVSNRTFPSKNMFTRDATKPADIVSINGFVFEGRLHAHLTMTDSEKAFGGHLEPGTNVFTFAILTLGVLPADMDVSRLDDKTWR